ncbi:hypothetical protein [Stackebrandtia sp.]|uniref:hypothetical protein n=1 Tax=Stackebrandtia sp. TaxID=2023065 RepID=UPI002D782B72|nr:hypothetical protein [Stackebrandtia sp.]
MVFATALVGSAAWFAILIASDSADVLPGFAAIAIPVLAVLLAVGALFVARRWVALGGWTARHRAALFAGAMIPQMLPGCPGDIAFKVVPNLGMLAFPAVLAPRGGRTESAA